MFLLGNDQLRHLNETFVDWKATEWVETLKMHTHFTIDNGHVTVKQTGLYFVYAQVIVRKPLFFSILVSWSSNILFTKSVYLRSVLLNIS